MQVFKNSKVYKTENVGSGSRHAVAVHLYNIKLTTIMDAHFLLEFITIHYTQYTVCILTRVVDSCHFGVDADPQMWLIKNLHSKLTEIKIIAMNSKQTKTVLFLEFFYK